MQKRARNLFFGVFVIGGLCAAEDTIFHASISKPRCLIFTSDGGGGHRSADKALRQYLEPDFEVELGFMIRDVLAQLDPFRWATFNRFGAEDLYNFFITKRFFRTINVLGHFGSWSEWWLRGRIEKLIFDYVSKHKPDIMISVIPFYNGPLLAVAEKLNIPLYIIPTDLDTTTFAYDIRPTEYQNWWFIKPFEDDQLDIFRKKTVPDARVITGGFPIRKNFFGDHDTDQIYTEFAIPEDKPVATLLMGAAGSSGSYDALKELIKISCPVHILVCLGRNKALAQTLKALELPEHVTITVIEFTDKIADLMAISRVLITKSGSVSVCEGIYSAVPLLVDKTASVPRWEAYNTSYIVENGFGGVFTSYAQLPELLEPYLLDDAHWQATQERLELFERPELGTFLHDHIFDLMHYATPRKKISPTISAGD